MSKIIFKPNSHFNINGIDFHPGSDVDVDLIRVNVTGTPKLWWDQGTDSFEMNKSLTLPGGSLKIGSYIVEEDISDNDGLEMAGTFHIHTSGGISGNICIHEGTEPPVSVTGEGHRIWADIANNLLWQDSAGVSTVIFTGDPITGALVIDINALPALLVEQSGVHDNTLVVDTTNGRVGIGIAAPNSGLHYQGDILYLTPAAGAESNDNITIKNYATGNGAPDIILRTADIDGAYSIGVGTLFLIGGSKTTHYGGIGGGGGEISLQGGQGRDSANNPSGYAPILLQSNGGNVGIGTTEPGRNVEIYGTSSILRLRDSGATANATLAYIEFGGTNAAVWSRTGYIGDTSSGNADIYVRAEVGDLHLGDSSGGTVMNLQSGNVGIGETTPLARLHVKGTADDEQLIIQAHSTQNANLVEFQDSDGNVDSKISANRGAAFGAFDDGNYTEIEADGTVVFTGAATVFRDINLGAAVLTKPAVSQPDEVNFVDEAGADTGIASLGFAVGEKVSGNFELQHDYKEGTDLVFHIHWQGGAAPSGTDKVKWQLTYTVSQSETTLNATTTIVVETDFDTQYEFKQSDFPAITGTNFNIEDQFLFTLERIAASADEYAGDGIVATVGIHYEVSRIGSRTISAA